MARRNRRPLCKAQKASGGSCGNYRDTCPVRAHKTSRPTDVFKDRAKTATLRRSGTAGTALAADPALLARMCADASQHYNLIPELIAHDYQLIATPVRVDANRRRQPSTAAVSAAVAAGIRRPGRVRRRHVAVCGLGRVAPLVR